MSMAGSHVNIQKNQGMCKHTSQYPRPICATILPLVNNSVEQNAMPVAKNQELFLALQSGNNYTR